MASHQQQIRRGTDAQIAAFTPALGEVVYNTTTKRLHAGDGATLGGIPAARLDELVSSVPPGGIMAHAGASAPSGWLLCYGQAVDRDDYADLFAEIGVTFGSGDGSTTFNLPDLRGRVIAGQDDMGGSSANRLTSPLNGDTFGAAGGAESVTLAANNIPANVLTTDGGPAPSGDPGVDQDYVKSTSHTGSGSSPVSVVQPTMVLNWIIKY